MWKHSDSALYRERAPSPTNYCLRSGKLINCCQHAIETQNYALMKTQLTVPSRGQHRPISKYVIYKKGSFNEFSILTFWRMNNIV